MSSGELTRIVKLDRLPATQLTIAADADERTALARRFGLPAIDALSAEVRFDQTGAQIDARGWLQAAFTQRCAIADEPFANAIEAPIALRFVPSIATHGEDEEIEFDPNAPDEIEYDGAALDLGEAVAQSFGLLIDPYALGPNAEAARREAGLVDDDAPSGPFAALAALRPGTKATEV